MPELLALLDDDADDDDDDDGDDREARWDTISLSARACLLS